MLTLIKYIRSGKLPDFMYFMYVPCAHWDPNMFTLIKYLKSGKLSDFMYFINVNIMGPQYAHSNNN